jgi:hypothetical protein
MAQHLPTTFIAVPNDDTIFPNSGANSDRFKDPEAAGRTSIERHNTLLVGYYYVFDHVEYHEFGGTSGAQYWDIYAYLHEPPGVRGPYLHGSSAIRHYVCDATPRIGPNYSADSQGWPKVFTYNPHTYANGCPAPQLDIDKNPCLGNCAGNPINVGVMSKVQLECGGAAG